MGWSIFGRQKMERFCEKCGNKVQNPYYTALFSIDYLIFSRNSAVRHVDRANGRVVLVNGDVLNFQFPTLDEHTFAMPYRSNEHLLCSEACEDTIVRKQAAINPNIYQKTHIVHCRSEGWQYICAIPATRLKGTMKRCDQCGDNYPSFGRVWKEAPIIDRQRILGNISSPPSYDKDRCMVILTGLCKGRVEAGYWYQYEIDDSKPFSDKNFCSYDCAFGYSKEKNVLIYVDSVLEKDQLGTIVPDTEAMNEDLRNPMPHRPTFSMQL